MQLLKLHQIITHLTLITNSYIFSQFQSIRGPDKIIDLNLQFRQQESILVVEIIFSFSISSPAWIQSANGLISFVKQFFEMDLYLSAEASRHQVTHEDITPSLMSSWEM